MAITISTAAHRQTDLFCFRLHLRRNGATTGNVLVREGIACECGVNQLAAAPYHPPSRVNIIIVFIFVAFDDFPATKSLNVVICGPIVCEGLFIPLNAAIQSKSTDFFQLDCGYLNEASAQYVTKELWNSTDRNKRKSNTADTSEARATWPEFSAETNVLNSLSEIIPSPSVSEDLKTAMLRVVLCELCMYI